MKRIISCFLLLSSIVVSAQEKVDFNKYFTGQTLRFDYYHTGDAKTEVYAADKIYKQGVWAGNPSQCIQPFELGLYKVRLYDATSNKEIYSKGYSTIFGEYQTTQPALDGVSKTYHETVLVPFPKNKVKLVIEKRAKNNSTSPVYSIVIDPTDYHIITENVKRSGDEVIAVTKQNDPHKSVDVVILGEGYSASEKEKFRRDLEYFSNLLLNFEPYKSYKQVININGVFAPSEESGLDEPRQGIYRNTRFSSSFNTFDIDRYCLADDNKSIRDAAAPVPYDAILIMVNKDRYGGGGIYNWQTIFAIGSDKKDYVFLHEFGHGFAGLADEYYASSVAYVDIFVPGVEPLEPNITALLDPSNVKWKQYLSPGIQVPTEWGKAKFDSMNLALNKLYEKRSTVVDDMKKKGASTQEIQSTERDYSTQISKLGKQIDDFLFNHPLKDKVGVFEGANYLTKGYYRSSINSMMQKFSPEQHSYGVVNDQAVIATIRYYTGE
jgi:hypothetical protein